MNIEQIRAYCLSKPAVDESLPFNDTALVFKVGGKMFAVLDLSDDKRGITLKCDPELAIKLREEHSEVTPAWHFNKTYWNGIVLTGTITQRQIREWIDHSYDLVFESLPKKIQEQINLNNHE
ncbi:MAG: MmcQ/YjbR family DNA-binding protein [Bacteroidales bacterium]|nr:MmcQ/YjbR family DNA-binding protein [Bacteroidales bacterium]MBN2818594.1 MmcQ/YjbR family DNA-binding protein [Bacteroidales bacterium]